MHDNRKEHNRQKHSFTSRFPKFHFASAIRYVQVVMQWVWNAAVYMQAEKGANIKDVQDFMVTVPTLEYHNRNWTWGDMLMEVKKVYKQHIIQKVCDIPPHDHLNAFLLLYMCMHRELKLYLV